MMAVQDSSNWNDVMQYLNFAIYLQFAGVQLHAGQPIWFWKKTRIKVNKLASLEATLVRNCPHLITDGGEV